MSDHIKARKWREKVGLSRDELAEMAGYSRESVYLFEKGFIYDRRGMTEKGKVRTKEIDRKAWHRYRMACAGVSATLSGLKFNW